MKKGRLRSATKKEIKEPSAQGNFRIKMFKQEIENGRLVLNKKSLFWEVDFQL